MYIDFCSLHQPPADGGSRAADEQRLHERAMAQVGELFAHPHTLTMHLTALPEAEPPDSPAGASDDTISVGAMSAPVSRRPSHDAPPAPAAASGQLDSPFEQLDLPFEERAQCFLELCCSALVKERENVLDLASFNMYTPRELMALVTSCTADRPPPLSPADFGAQLATKVFMPGATLRERDEMAATYKSTFMRRFVPVRQLNYSGLEWGNGHVHTLCRALMAAECLPWCTRLDLSFNDLTSTGMHALGECLAREVRTPHLDEVALEENPASEEACAEVRATIRVPIERAQPEKVKLAKRSAGEAAAHHRVARAARVGHAVNDALSGRPRRRAYLPGEGPLAVDALYRQWVV